MNHTDTPKTPAAGVGLDRAQELRAPAPEVSTSSTDTGNNLASPRFVERDPAFYRKREETLRATGEILHQRCVAKLEKLNQVLRARSS